MTEQEWLSSPGPAAMLEFLRASGRASDRKHRLFAVACSRRVWDLIDQQGRAAVEVAERYADGMAGPEELRAARLACRFAGSQAAWYAAATSPVVAARNAALSAQHGAQAARNDPHSCAECLAQADLLRDIFFNPFHSPPSIPAAVLAWSDGCLVKRANSLYAERDFSPERMAGLAHALEEAGVTNEEVLGHCQRGSVHVRGCWLVDLLTGRA
jgi:hypothetical protein